MRQGTYLNAILTVNAVLLSALLWVQLAGGPSLEANAAAQAPPGVGIPNAADQRQRMIDALHDIKSSVDSTRRILEGGKLRVEVTNLDKIKIEPKSKD